MRKQKLEPQKDDEYGMGTPLSPPDLGKGQAQNQYIWGGYIAAVSAIRAVLPQYIDDVQRDFGDDIYDRMMTDAMVASSLETRVEAILGDGIRIEPALQKPGTNATQEEMADAEIAQQIADDAALAFLGNSALEGQSLRDSCHDMIKGALGYGSRVAEVTYKEGSGPLAGKLVPRCIKPKKRLSTAYVIDQYGTVLGLIGGTALSGGRVIIAGTVYYQSFSDIQPFIPIEKCLIFCNRSQHNDPRGTSVLRAAYNPWYMKTQVIPEFYKFLRQFATPTPIGYTPESGPETVTLLNANGTPTEDAAGNPIQISAEQALLNALMNWMNGEALAVRGGSQIDLVKSSGSDSSFGDGLYYFDAQVVSAILGTTRLTMEAKHGSRADSGTAQDVVGLRIASDKMMFESQLNRSLMEPFVRFNYPKKFQHLAPKFVMSKVEQQDVAARVTAYGQAYAQGLIKDFQLPDLYSQLGLPQMSVEDIQADRSKKLEEENLYARQYLAQNGNVGVANPQLETISGDIGAQ